MFFGNMCETLGLLYIVAVLGQHGMEIGVIDGVGEELKHEDLEDRTAEFDPHVVGIACMMAETYSDSAETAKIARQAPPKAKLILGGYNASFVADKIIDNLPAADYVVVGEGEYTFLDLVPAQFRDNATRMREQKIIYFSLFRQRVSERKNFQAV